MRISESRIKGVAVTDSTPPTFKRLPRTFDGCATLSSQRCISLEPPKLEVTSIDIGRHGSVMRLLEYLRPVPSVRCISDDRAVREDLGIVCTAISAEGKR